MGVSAKSLLKDAVRQEEAAKKQKALQRLFIFWFNGLVYNQIWEDPRVDVEALQVNEQSRILTIASGGCNIVNYLTSNPGRITAVDLNPFHIYLTRLKLCAFQHLPSYEDFFRFFALANDKKNVENYKLHLRDKLDQDARSYWDGHSLFCNFLITPRIHRFAEGFYNYSRSGYFLRFLHFIGRIANCDISRMLEARSLEEQVEIFEKHVEPSFDHWIVKTLGRLPFMVYSLGIPPQQFAVMRSEGATGIVDLFRQRARRLACNFPIEENYFAWQAFGRKYNTASQKSLPEYLKEENYEAIKSRLGAVNTEIGDLISYLGEQQPDSFDCFVLLDSQDWMNADKLSELWTQIARVGQPGARIIFRTAGSESPIETALEGELRERFHYEQEWSRELYEKDRAAVYGGFHLYRLNQ